MNELKKGCVVYYVHDEENFECIIKSKIIKIENDCVLIVESWVPKDFVFKTKKEVDEKLILLLKKISKLLI